MELMKRSSRSELETFFSFLNAKAKEKDFFLPLVEALKLREAGGRDSRLNLSNVIAKLEATGFILLQNKEIDPYFVGWGFYHLSKFYSKNIGLWFYRLR